MKNKKSDWVIVILFLLFLYGITIGNLIGKDRLFSPMENRMLQQKPKLEVQTVLSGEYMKKYETYMTDQFVWRDGFIRVKGFSERSLGKKENHGVYYGKGGYLAEQMQRVEKEQLAKNIEAVRRFCENTEQKVSFALIPGSVEVNRERFSSFLPDVRQQEVIDKLYEELMVTDVILIDMVEKLKSHRQEELYYRTDHHWTSLGAYYGYQAFMEAKGESAVALSAYTETVQTEEFYGTLYSKTGAFWIAPDKISTYVEPDGIVVERIEGEKAEPGGLYVKSYLQKKDKYSMFLGGNQPLGVIKTGREDLPRILVIRDSYMDSMAPFLIPHYSEIYLLDFRYNRMDVQTFMEEKEIDEVLICYSLENFQKDKNIGFMLR